MDANVLYSRTLCDWIFMLRLEAPGMFRLYSSADVLDEVAYHLRKNKPLADGRVIQAKRDHLRRFLDDVVTDFPGDVPFAGDDAHDVHLHAAAVESIADYLVSDDRGFEALNKDSAPYEPHTADTFLCLIAENAPFAVQEVITRQLAYWSGREGARSLTDALREAGCPVFAGRVESALRAITDGRSVVGALSPATGQ
ncbi:PIN domain-containing protein [Microbacterium aurantiacum]|uniref:PIN domain-containing protein n=1 Tax=Microbacterium aurantiacum TaxID=162393 RepID=UPI00341962CF